MEPVSCRDSLTKRCPVCRGTGSDISGQPCKPCEGTGELCEHPQPVNPAHRSISGKHYSASREIGLPAECGKRIAKARADSKRLQVKSSEVRERARQALRRSFKGGFHKVAAAQRVPYYLRYRAS